MDACICYLHIIHLIYAIYKQHIQFYSYFENLYLPMNTYITEKKKKNQHLFIPGN